MEGEELSNNKRITNESLTVAPTNTPKAAESCLWCVVSVRVRGYKVRAHVREI